MASLLGTQGTITSLQKENAEVHDELRATKADVFRLTMEVERLNKELAPLYVQQENERAAAAALLVRNSFLEEALRRGQRALRTSQFLVSQLGAPPTMEAVVPTEALDAPRGGPRVRVPEVVPHRPRPFPAADASRPAGDEPSRAPVGALPLRGMENVDRVVGAAMEMGLTAGAAPGDRMVLFTDYVAGGGGTGAEKRPSTAGLRGHDAIAIPGLPAADSRPGSSRGGGAQSGDATPQRPATPPRAAPAAAAPSRTPPRTPETRASPMPTVPEDRASPAGSTSSVFQPPMPGLFLVADAPRPGTTGSLDRQSRRPGTSESGRVSQAGLPLTRERRVREIRRHLEELGEVPAEIEELVRPPPRVIHSVADLVELEVDVAMAQTEREAALLAAEKVRAVMAGHVRVYLDEAQMRWVMDEAGADPSVMDPDPKARASTDRLVDEAGRELVRKDQADAVVRELRARIFWIRASMGVVADFSRALRKRIEGLEKDNLELVVMLDRTKVEMMELLIAQQKRWHHRSQGIMEDRQREVAEVRQALHALRVEAAELQNTAKKAAANLALRDTFLAGVARVEANRRTADCQAGASSGGEARAFLASLGPRRNAVHIMSP